MKDNILIEPAIYVKILYTYSSLINVLPQVYEYSFYRNKDEILGGKSIEK